MALGRNSHNKLTPTRTDVVKLPVHMGQSRGSCSSGQRKLAQSSCEFTLTSLQAAQAGCLISLADIRDSLGAARAGVVDPLVQGPSARHSASGTERVCSRLERTVEFSHGEGARGLSHGWSPQAKRVTFKINEEYMFGKAGVCPGRPGRGKVC